MLLSRQSGKPRNTPKPPKQSGSESYPGSTTSAPGHRATGAGRMPVPANRNTPQQIAAALIPDNPDNAEVVKNARHVIVAGIEALKDQHGGAPVRVSVNATGMVTMRVPQSGDGANLPSGEVFEA